MSQLPDTHKKLLNPRNANVPRGHKNKKGKDKKGKGGKMEIRMEKDANLIKKLHREIKSLKTLSVSKPKEDKFDKAIIVAHRASDDRVKALMKMICDPQDAPLVRAGQDGGYTTAIRRINTNFTPSFFNANKQMLIFIFRSPFRSCIYSYTTTGSFRYDFLGKVAISEVAQNVNSYTFTFDIAGTKINVEQNLDVAYATIYATANDRPHGTVLYPVKVEGSRRCFFYKGGLDSIKVDHVQTGTGTWQYKTYCVINGEEQEIQTIQATATGTLILVNVGIPAGYYAVSATLIASTSVTATTGAFYIDNSVTGTTWAHLSAQDIGSELTKMGDMRETAKSLLVTNGSPELQLQGFVTAVQLSGNLSWIDVSAYADPFKQISGMNGRLVPSDFKDGFFTWLRPTNVRDFDFEKNVDCNTNGVNYAGDIIDSDDSFMAISVRVSDSTAQVYNCVVGDVYEYRSNSQQDDPKFSEMSMLETQKAFDALRAIPQFTHNPNHIREIWSKIKKVSVEMFGMFKAAAPVILQAGEFLASL